MKYALIDMGSNSIRMTVYDISHTGFKILFKEKIMAGLAGYVENGILTQEGIDQACHALQEFQHTIDLLHIEQLSVFATASLRNVANTSEAVEQIHLATGISVEVLSGKDEAEYGYYGAVRDIQMSDGLFVDIGGASAEIVLLTDGKIKQSESVPVGSLKLYRDCVKKILPGKDEQKRMEEVIRKAFGSSKVKNIPRQEHMVCVGGTARAALRLCRKLYGLPDDCRSFSRKQLDSLVKCLCKTDKNAVDLILRYETKRIHTLIPGLMILRYLAEQYEISDITVSSYGVREGYLSQRILIS